MTADEETRAAGLMREGQQGDERAYADLLVLLTSVSIRYARRRIGRVPWVDDVVQETLITVHRARHTYDPARPFAPWFYAILSSRLIDVLRREKRVGERELGADVLPDVESVPGHESWGPAGRSTLDVDRIRAAVRALPERQRVVVEALKYRDETVGEAARRLRLTEASVKITAHRGYKALRRLLGGTSRED